MGTNSKIEWTDHTWNPWRGCSKVSAGCDNCYMFRDAKRFGLDPDTVTRQAPATLRAPLVKTRPKKTWPPVMDHGEPAYKWPDGDKVFVCSWSDFFHSDADGMRAEAWGIIRQRPGLIFQILTKRPERIAECLPADWGEGWPNVWLGVTAENQAAADARIPILLATPAAVRFVSIEPMVGPVDLRSFIQLWGENGTSEHVEKYGWKYDEWSGGFVGHGRGDPIYEPRSGLDWIICGGESGLSARPMHPDWARTVRDQCVAAGVPFFFKQWGEWWPDEQGQWLSEAEKHVDPDCDPDRDGEFYRLGRKLAGCQLDDREWKEFPA